MINIIADKILHFTDLHIGIKGDNLNRLDICKKTVNNIIDVIKRDSIKHVVFEGDLFHSRVSLNVNTINIAIELIESIAEHATVYLIIGNHDSHFKNTTDIHSIKIFNNTKNVNVISDPTELVINNNYKYLLIPWYSDLSKFKEEDFDTICGHFEFSAKYLIASYIEEQQNISKENIISGIVDKKLDEYMTNPADVYSEDINEIFNNRNTIKSTSYIGEFINKCKKGGLVFSGHIHKRKEFNVKKRRFVFVGSPLQQTFGDLGNSGGFYIHDIKNDEIEFIENKGIPVHVEILSSDITETFDYTICNNNYVKLIINTTLDYIQLARIMDKINENKPFELSAPEYRVVVDNTLDLSKVDENASENIQKSKKSYIIEYVSTINNDELEKNLVKRETVFNILNSYFKSGETRLAEINNTNNSVD